ncbi:xanthotoxin 5-hydroxylase CYP82C4-like [Lycium ferocissimum]|uniref:xanthotoxin 5-hydroxylase CYP82C4-like n=1 Tax=Lycium ferocissimum TaxID=112874 RepID=UPI002814C2FE|nr:xanthotoxin 5-hydroxylase CYP82C4-like [Lycium ferocissimum]
MHFLSQLLALFVTWFLAFFVARKYKIRNRSSAHNAKSNSTTISAIGAPKAPGSWPIIGHLHLLSGQLPVCRTLGLMADKYGPIFQLQLGARPALVVSSWEMVKDCFTNGNDKIFATRPSMVLSKYFYNGKVFAFAPYGPYWRDIRKMVTLEVLTNSRLEKLKHVRTSEVNCCIKELYYSNWSNSSNDFPAQVNLSSWFEHITCNIIIIMLAGKRFSSSVNEKSGTEEMQFKESIKKALLLGGTFVVSDAIPSLEWMDIGGHIEAMKQTIKEVDRVFDSWLKEHIQKRKDCEINSTDGDQSDFIDVMLSTLPEETMESGYDRDAIIKATTLILIMTASESTAETLIWALSLLMNDTRSLKVAQDELDEHVGRNRWVEESDIKNLPYLQAIIKETLRLYPPGPLSGPREASEDCYVDKFRIHKGTRLIVNLWKLQRDPRIWEDPDEFKPERWFMKEHVNINFRGQNFEYIPFSSGRRMCPGLMFGTQVVHLTLARLLHGFNISMPREEPVDLSEGLGIALPKMKPLQPLLSPRLTVELYQSL